ncbi:MAG: imidazolonepropionase [Ignavibacteriae bacterium]|nr:imidazolonepropionase [Ignavibacteriota bacterium]NOG99127.1 imidazolonepropionase [Ignavibacteriota bacterium]
MRTLIKNSSQIITVDTEGRNLKRGKDLQEVYPLYEHSIIIEDEIIKDFVKSASVSDSDFDNIIDAAGKVVTPGLVECHTHTAYAGSRAEEFRLRLGGKSYEEIAEAGGGINATVQAVRKSSFDELVSLVQPRINYFISQGITTLEIKSGYGLSYYDEIKLLQVINHLNKIFPIDIIPTFLGAHTFPPEYKNDHQQYIDVITEELMPYIAENKLAQFCDAFCEQTAFSADETEIIFVKAREHGLKLKLHTEQFNNIGGLQTALNNKAISVDHLEVLAENDIDALSKSETTAVLLPGVSFFLDYDFAPARKLIENNAIVALATDYNPGSSHISNLSFIMSLAALKMNMTIEETLSAVTINAAKALDVSTSIGSLEIGKKADFAVFDTTEYSDIVYNVGKNLNCITIKNGKIIYQN